MIQSHCARCRRPIRKVVIVEGKGYGVRCAAKMGDLLTQPAERKPTRARRSRPEDARQLQLEAQP